MDNDDDFTFCQVSTLGSQDTPEVESLPLDKGFSQNGNVLSNGAASKKQETVGSLSFSVIDATKQSSQASKSATESGTSVSDTKNPKPAMKKPAPRAKIPFEKGYSQMDWLRLTRTHPDLAGLKGQSNKRLIPMSEVKKHQSEDSMWTVLKGRVYNLTPYMKFHPGGFDILKKAIGKDCTALFNKYHAWVNAEFLLEKCVVGVLDETQ